MFGSQWLIQLRRVIEYATLDGFDPLCAGVQFDVLQNLLIALFLDRIEHAIAEEEVGLHFLRHFLLSMGYAGFVSNCSTIPLSRNDLISFSMQVSQMWFSAVVIVSQSIRSLPKAKPLPLTPAPVPPVRIGDLQRLHS
jgi:hypothetical protein